MTGSIAPTEQYAFPRLAEQAVRDALQDTRVVLLNGARQTGKSTLARHVAASVPGALVRRLDDPATLVAARRDPVEFLRHDGLLVIDEVQRAPELLLPLKDNVDLDPRPGRFLLTGSAQVLALRGVPDALTGRVEVIELWPLAQCEIERAEPTFVERAFGQVDAPWLDAPADHDKRHYCQLVARGGFPTSVQREDPRRRSAFFRSYVSTLVERDVTELSKIDQLDVVDKLLRLLAARTAMPLVEQGLVRDLGSSRATTARYLALLAQVFAIKRIPAWSANATSRATAHPKLVLVDSGVNAHLLGRTAQHLVHDHEVFGQLLESFVLGELARLVDHAFPHVRLHHYRTRDGVEVDAVLESADGRVVAIEVKAASTVTGRDARGLEHLAQRLGDRFAAGYVLYTGSHALPFGNRLHALPVSALWDARAST